MARQNFMEDSISIELSTELNEVNLQKNISTITKALKAIEKTAAESGRSIKDGRTKAGKAVKELTAQLEQQNKSLTIINRGMLLAETHAKSLSKAAGALGISYAGTSTAVDKTNTALATQTALMSKLTAQKQKSISFNSKINGLLDNHSKLMADTTPVKNIQKVNYAYEQQKKVLSSNREELDKLNESYRRQEKFEKMRATTRERTAARARAEKSGFNQMRNTAKQRINLLDATNMELAKENELIARKNKELDKTEGVLKRIKTATTGSRKSGSYNGEGGFFDTITGGVGTSFGHKVATTAQYATAGLAFYAFTEAIMSVVRATAQFDLAIRTMAAVLDESLMTTERMGQQLNELGKEFGGVLDEIYGVSLALGRAGIQTEKLVVATEIVIKMARLTGDTLAESTKAVVSYQQVFGDTHSIEDLGDKLAYVANASRLSTQDIGTFSNHALSAAKSSGITVDALGALAIAFSNAGVNASTIGTQIRTFANSMVENTTDLQDFFFNIGISQQNLLIDLQAGGEISNKAFIKVTKTLKNLTDSEFAKYTRSMDILQRDVFAKMRQNSDAIEEHLIGSLEKATGSLEKTQVIMDSYMVTWESFINSFKDLGIDAGSWLGDLTTEFVLLTRMSNEIYAGGGLDSVQAKLIKSQWNLLQLRQEFSKTEDEYIKLTLSDRIAAEQLVLKNLEDQVKAQEKAIKLSEYHTKLTGLIEQRKGFDASLAGGATLEPDEKQTYDNILKAIGIYKDLILELNATVLKVSKDAARNRLVLDEISIDSYVKSFKTLNGFQKAEGEHYLLIGELFDANLKMVRERALVNKEYSKDQIDLLNSATDELTITKALLALDKENLALTTQGATATDDELVAIQKQINLNNILAGVLDKQLLIVLKKKEADAIIKASIDEGIDAIEDFARKNDAMYAFNTSREAEKLRYQIQLLKDAGKDASGLEFKLKVRDFEESKVLTKTKEEWAGVLSDAMSTGIQDALDGSFNFDMFVSGMASSISSSVISEGLSGGISNLSNEESFGAANFASIGLGIGLAAVSDVFSPAVEELKRHTAYLDEMNKNTAATASSLALVLSMSGNLSGFTTGTTSTFDGVSLQAQNTNTYEQDAKVSVATGAIAGAYAGATYGAFTGPVGAAIGFAIGATIGAFAASELGDRSDEFIYKGFNDNLKSVSLNFDNIIERTKDFIVDDITETMRQFQDFDDTELFNVLTSSTTVKKTKEILGIIKDSWEETTYTFEQMTELQTNVIGFLSQFGVYESGDKFGELTDEGLEAFKTAWSKSSSALFQIGAIQAEANGNLEEFNRELTESTLEDTVKILEAQYGKQFEELGLTLAELTINNMTDFFSEEVRDALITAQLNLDSFTESTLAFATAAKAAADAAEDLLATHRALLDIEQYRADRMAELAELTANSTDDMVDNMRDMLEDIEKLTDKALSKAIDFAPSATSSREALYKELTGFQNLSASFASFFDPDTSEILDVSQFGEMEAIFNKLIGAAENIPGMAGLVGGEATAVSEALAAEMMKAADFFNANEDVLKVNIVADSIGIVPALTGLSDTQYAALTSLSTEQVTAITSLTTEQIASLSTMSAEQLVATGTLSAEQSEAIGSLSTDQVEAINTLSTDQVANLATSVSAITQDTVARVQLAFSDGLLTAAEIAELQLTQEQSDALTNTATNTEGTGSFTMSQWLKRQYDQYEDQINKDLADLTTTSFGAYDTLGITAEQQLTSIIDMAFGERQTADVVDEMFKDLRWFQSEAATSELDVQHLLALMEADAGTLATLESLFSEGLATPDMVAANEAIWGKYIADNTTIRESSVALQDANTSNAIISGELTDMTAWLTSAEVSETSTGGGKFKKVSSYDFTNLLGETISVIASGNASDLEALASAKALLAAETERVNALHAETEASLQSTSVLEALVNTPLTQGIGESPMSQLGLDLMLYYALNPLSAGQIGYASGGYTGDIPEDQIAGPVHGQEHVLNARSTRAINAIGSVDDMVNTYTRDGSGSGVVVEVDIDMNVLADAINGLQQEVSELKQLQVKQTANSNRQLVTQRAILDETVKQTEAI